MAIDPVLARAELAKRELARRHLVDYYAKTHPQHVPGAWQRHLCAALERFCKAVEERKAPRMIVLAPPQHGKSVIVSRAFPAWAMGRFPNWAWILGSYAGSLASGHGRWVRNALDSDMHRLLFPDPNARLCDDSSAADQMSLVGGGQLIARGVGGGTTGNPGRVFVVDDPFSDREEAESPVIRNKVWDWFSAVASTRLAPGGGILVMHTRWHEDDLVGRLLEQEKETGDKWEVLSYPAIALDDDMLGRAPGEPLHPERYDVAELARKKRGMIPRDWAALYQQSPIIDVGGYFQRSWFRTYTQQPLTGEVAIAADFAYRVGQDNDYTAALPFGMTETNDLTFLPGLFVERLEPNQSVERILDLAVATQARSLITGRDSLQSIGPFLRTRMQERKVWLTLHEMPENKNTGDLQARARSYQARTQQGKVLWPAGELFNDLILPQHLSFPAGKHDDSISAATMACYLLDTQPNYSAPPEPKWVNPDEKRWAQRGHKPTSTGIPSLFGRK